jgi:hypothetical protein
MFKTHPRFKIGTKIWYTSYDMPVILKGIVSDIKWIRHMKTNFYTLNLSCGASLSFFESQIGSNAFDEECLAKKRFAYYMSSNHIERIKRIAKLTTEIKELADAVEKFNEEYNITPKSKENANDFIRGETTDLGRIESEARIATERKICGS